MSLLRVGLLVCGEVGACRPRTSRDASEVHAWSVSCAGLVKQKKLCAFHCRCREKPVGKH
jgi:hypothetical protein